MSRDEYLSLWCLMAFDGATGHNCGGATPPSASASSSQPLLNFCCALCGKEFASYQALGGHMASHRKPAAPARNGTVPPFVPFPENEGAAPSSSAAGGGGRHVCTVCRRGFATGQARGGHKMFHYLLGPSVSASLASAAGSLVRGLDLNLAPMPPETALSDRKRKDEDQEARSPSLPAKKPRRHSNSSVLKRSRTQKR